MRYLQHYFSNTVPVVVSSLAKGTAGTTIGINPPNRERGQEGGRVWGEGRRPHSGSDQDNEGGRLKLGLLECDEEGCAEALRLGWKAAKRAVPMR
jgi:hypothetical protein